MHAAQKSATRLELLQPDAPSVGAFLGGDEGVWPAPLRGTNARTVYLPSATNWVFSSLHTSVGQAFVGAVVGEYLGSARGVGYLIPQAEGAFDVNTVFAGIVVLMM